MIKKLIRKLFIELFDEMGSIKTALDSITVEIDTDRYVQQADDAFVTNRDEGLNYNLGKYVSKFSEVVYRNKSLESLINKTSYLLYRYTDYSRNSKLDLLSLTEFKLELDIILNNLSEYNYDEDGIGFDGMCVKLNSKIIGGTECQPAIKFEIIDESLAVVKIPHKDFVENIRINANNLESALIAIVNKDLYERR